MRKSCIFVNGNLHSKINSDNEIQLVSGTTTEIELVDKCSDINNGLTRVTPTDTSQSSHVESVTSIILNPVVVEALFTTSNLSINPSTDTPHCLVTPRKSPL